MCTLQLRYVTCRINAHRLIHMADVGVKPCWNCPKVNILPIEIVAGKLNANFRDLKS